eukprot:8779071-Alexandrium_andersonii.AAC.1
MVAAGASKPSPFLAIARARGPRSGHVQQARGRWWPRNSADRPCALATRWGIEALAACGGHRRPLLEQKPA